MTDCTDHMDEFNAITTTYERNQLAQGVEDNHDGTLCHVDTPWALTPWALGFSENREDTDYKT